MTTTLRTTLALSLLAVPACASSPEPAPSDTLAGCWYFEQAERHRSLNLPWGVWLSDEPLTDWPPVSDRPGTRLAVTLVDADRTADHPFGYWQPGAGDTLGIGYPGVFGGLSLGLVVDGHRMEGTATPRGDAGLGERPRYDVALMRAECPEGLIGEDGQAVAPDITAAGLMEDVLALSADSMEGRAPGTRGEERAVRYIERRFREVGLDPVDEDYRLPFDLVGMTKDADGSRIEVTGPGGPLGLEEGENFTYWSTLEEPVVEIEAPLVFVGYGVTAPEHDWDDFEGADLSGKVLLFLNNDPPVTEDGRALFGGEARTYYGRWTYKFEQADRLGAAGAVVVHTTESASYGFSVIGDMGAERNWRRGYRVPMLAWVDSTASERIAAAMGTDLDGLFEMAARREFRPVDTGFMVEARIETEIERVEATNVAGVIPGSDPELADEYLVFTAHHDHLGIDPTREGDQIYNGALDNALGVASIIAAADAMVDARPRRSVMFVSVSAEEGGLLGSSAFVEDPPVPLDQIVANFNIDSPQPFGLTRDVAAIGLEMNTLGATFRTVARERGLVPKGDPEPAAGRFYRSDQVNFAKAGVPALYLQRGTNYVRDLGFDPVAYHLERYHQVTDEVTDAWDLRGAARDIRVLVETALRVANADAQPRWNPGNEFEEEWRALYGR